MSIPQFLKNYDGYGEYTIFAIGYMPDDYGSGNVPSPVPVGSVWGTVSLNDSVNMKIAQAQGVKGVYRFVTDRDVNLPWHTIIQSVDNGQTFRVTSREPQKTPKGAGTPLAYVDLEEYTLAELTNG